MTKGSAAPKCRPVATLRVAEEGLESVVHVLLYMAVEERQARLVGYEVNHGAAVIRNDYRVFYDAAGLGAVHFYQLELMAM